MMVGTNLDFFSLENTRSQPVQKEQPLLHNRLMQPRNNLTAENVQVNTEDHTERAAIETPSEVVDDL